MFNKMSKKTYSFTYNETEGWGNWGLILGTIEAFTENNLTYVLSRVCVSVVLISLKLFTTSTSI